MGRPAGEESDRGRGVTRRAVLRDGGALALAVFVSRDVSALAGVAVPVPGDGPVFLTERELETLRALVDRLVPGTRAKADPGAVAAGCAEAIDALLGAFSFDPPRIYAGAPFSDRAGSEVNHFAEFLPLDPYEEKAWRLRIEGSGGRPELEFNGPVKGWQATYRDGLAALDRAAAPNRFADLPRVGRELILRSADDPAITALIDLAFPHTLELMYGAPEYGGNRDLAGWRITNYAGDVQPRGWTTAEVEQPDPPGLTELLPDLPIRIPLERLLALAPLASPELAHNLVARSGGTLSGLRAELAPVRETLSDLLGFLEDAVGGR